MQSTWWFDCCLIICYTYFLLTSNSFICFSCRILVWFLKSKTTFLFNNRERIFYRKMTAFSLLIYSKCSNPSLNDKYLKSSSPYRVPIILKYPIFSSRPPRFFIPVIPIECWMFFWILLHCLFYSVMRNCVLLY